MRSIFTFVVVSLSVPACIPAMANSIGYTMADSTGTLSVTTPFSNWWANGNSTANAAAGVTIGGTNGGTFSGTYGALPVWGGTLAANGTTLTAAAGNLAGAPTPTASSVPYYPLGFWAANQKGGAVVNIPTAGYFNIKKNNGTASATMSNTIGNAAGTGSATWAWAPGGLGVDWTGTESASVGKVAKNGAALPANTRAVSDVSDPLYLYIAYDDEPLTFQVALANLEMDIAADQPADAYYSWSVAFGSGEVAGQNVLFTDSGGQDYSTPGTYTPNPGTVVDYSSSTLSAGVYWVTADLNLGAEAMTPEPATYALVGGCLLCLSGVGRRRS